MAGKPPKRDDDTPAPAHTFDLSDEGGWQDPESRPSDEAVRISISDPEIGHTGGVTTDSRWSGATGLTGPQLTWSTRPELDAFTVRFKVPGYKLLRPLAHGGMGEVYLAERRGDTGVGVLCALKVILPSRVGDEGFQARFLNEARMASKLRHPNVVQVFDVGRVLDRLFIAMEWVEGLDARGLMRRARQRKAEIPLKHVLFVLRESLKGLHYAHTAKDPSGQPLGLVHRDLSPENLLLSRDGAVKLTDFGVAQEQATGPRKRRLAGKVHYFAPELFKGARASVQSDLFALGVTFYEMLTVRPLFSRKLALSDVKKAIKDFDPEERLAGDLTIPDELEDILLRVLAADPADRYGSALELLEDVNDYLYESGLRLLDAHFAEYVQRVLSLPFFERRETPAGLEDWEASSE